MMEKRKRGRGFTLIEVLMAIIILATVLMTLITVFLYGFDVLSRTKQVALATQIAQEEIEAIRNMPFSDILTLGTTFTNEELTRLHHGQGSLALEDSEGENIKKLTVSITWDHHGKQMRKDIVTLITKQGINKK